jgi:RNA polymerase sigma factor (sigma-70 family)
VISHAYIDWWRRRTWRETPTDELPEPETTYVDHADTLARRDVVMRALSQLTRRERAMVSLRHLYGLSEAEVARELGCPVGTVKSGTARALAKLRADPLLRADQAILASEPEPSR